MTTKTATKAGTPRLSFRAMLREENKNQILEAGEQVTVTVEVTNAGSGVAHQVQVMLDGSPALVQRLPNPLQVGDLQPGETKLVEASGKVPPVSVAEQAELVLSLASSSADAQEPAAFQSADLRSGAELAYRLGKEALERTPQADALFIGGGAWLVEPAAERLEREFGKPVITSLNGAVRAILKEFGEWRPFPAGFGRVLEVE